MFINSLYQITIPDEDRRDEEKNYHRMSLGQMNNNFTKVDWVSLVNNMLSTVGIRVERTEPVIVYAPQYLTDLCLLLEDYMNTAQGKM